MMGEIVITEAMIAAAIIEHGIRRWRLRACSICGAPLFYVFAEGEVSFDGSCYCTRRSAPPERRSLQELVETFARQTPEVRDRMWAEFIASGESGG